MFLLCQKQTNKIPREFVNYQHFIDIYLETLAMGRSIYFWFELEKFSDGINSR